MMPLLPVRLIIVGFAMLLAASLIPARGAEPAKPNVLLLMVDDLNSWLLGDTNRYAGKVVAPNLQRLAKSGVVFERAYMAAPVCSPSRTSPMRPADGSPAKGVQLAQLCEQAWLFGNNARRGKRRKHLQR